MGRSDRAAALVLAATVEGANPGRSSRGVAIVPLLGRLRWRNRWGAKGILIGNCLGQSSKWHGAY